MRIALQSPYLLLEESFQATVQGGGTQAGASGPLSEEVGDGRLGDRVEDSRGESDHRESPRDGRRFTWPKAVRKQTRDRDTACERSRGKTPAAHHRRWIGCVPTSQSGKCWSWAKHSKWCSAWWGTISHGLTAALIPPNDAENKP